MLCMLRVGSRAGPLLALFSTTMSELPIAVEEVTAGAAAVIARRAERAETLVAVASQDAEGGVVEVAAELSEASQPLQPRKPSGRGRQRINETGVRAGRFRSESRYLIPGTAG